MYPAEYETYRSLLIFAVYIIYVCVCYIEGLEHELLCR